ncbi:MAG: class I SAM-dependent DNA methyltransferase [Acutalibacteraceae bacterium]|jgi:ubiquinone/menaquinone biosynthesis C-methylase UbiE
MSSYRHFAAVYDRLMRDVDYNARTDYLLRLFKEFGAVPTLLLDLACGSGGFSNLFSKKGIEVIGVDMSEEMLSVARQNSYDMGTDVLYLCQSAEKLDLYGTVDGAICCLDSLNHITDKEKLLAAVERVALFLEKDCLFIFDVNTEYKHREILADNTFVIDEDDLYCVWQNRFIPQKLTTEITLDFFVKTGKFYTRSGERFFERAYTPAELDEILKTAGFKIEAVYDDMTENPPHDTSQRVVYVCRKS